MTKRYFTIQIKGFGSLTTVGGSIPSLIILLNAFNKLSDVSTSPVQPKYQVTKWGR